MRYLIFTLAAALLPGVAAAGEADVLDARADKAADGTWRFAVTVRHADAGWDHYADAWQVLAPDGTVLGTRTLLHPHETEQPFTRTLSGVLIPGNVRTVRLRARDSVHGLGGAELEITLQR